MCCLLLIKWWKFNLKSSFVLRIQHRGCYIWCQKWDSLANCPTSHRSLKMVTTTLEEFIRDQRQEDLLLWNQPVGGSKEQKNYWYCRLWGLSIVKSNLFTFFLFLWISLKASPNYTWRSCRAYFPTVEGESQAICSSVNRCLLQICQDLLDDFQRWEISSLPSISPPHE